CSVRAYGVGHGAGNNQVRSPQMARKPLRLRAQRVIELAQLLRYCVHIPAASRAAYWRPDIWNQGPALSTAGFRGHDRRSAVYSQGFQYQEGQDIFLLLRGIPPGENPRGVQPSGARVERARSDPDAAGGTAEPANRP